MSYLVETTRGNGYRCSCCSHETTDSEWYDELEDALAELPTVISTGDWEITEVEITDGSTQEIVAWGRATWSTGYERYSGYNYPRWHGNRPDTGEFDLVLDRDGREIDKTWAELLHELKEKKLQKDLEKAQSDLEEAQRRLESLAIG